MAHEGPLPNANIVDIDIRTQLSNKAQHSHLFLQFVQFSEGVDNERQFPLKFVQNVQSSKDGVI
jgi:hypothetical protein